VHEPSPVAGPVVVALTGCALAARRAWDPAVIGSGAREVHRLLHGFLLTAAALGLVILALDLEEGRPWVFAVLPGGVVLALAGRVLLNHDLHRRRRRGQLMLRVLAVGEPESVAALIVRTRRAPGHGWRVEGACTPTGTGPDGGPVLDGVPVVGDLDSVSRLARGHLFDVVSVGRAPGWGTARLRRLAAELEGTGTALTVDPGLMEVAEPRLHMTAVDGLPLLRVSHPRFTGGARLLKGTADRIGALLLLAVLALPMAVIAVLVGRDGGPVFFLQRRVGVRGREFRMVKFRSMVVDAETRLADLRAADQGNGVMFKMRRDPRVTRVGEVLRRYSLDELPQLFNVLAGTMSLVGPRPPLPREVAGYADDARRRLLVKPGMTGLWQVSGRSDLSWEETVRLDLRYVENWTMALDAQILARTVHAMVRGEGAY